MAALTNSPSISKVYYNITAEIFKDTRQKITVIRDGIRNRRKNADIASGKSEK
jgi:hypothetical protein